jgi:ABC-type glycerol-3-phosphate transport system substrate-binding protein
MKSYYSPRRRAAAKAGQLALIALAALSFSAPVRAASVSGDLVLLNWASGSEEDMLKALEAGFMKANPGVHFKEINLTVQGDQRGAIRAALQSGEKADIFINTWPAFRKELVDAGMLKDLTGLWDSAKIGDKLSDNWKTLGSIDGKVYGVTYTFGDRSAMFYRTDVMKKAGIDGQPKTWDEMVADFQKLKAINVTPIAIGAKVWSQTEWFESIYEHLNGIEMAAKLTSHQIPWTDPSVKNTLKKYAELLKAGCCGSADSMLAMDWDNASDALMKAETYGWQIIGMWNNDRAQTTDGLKQGVDYTITQFPAMGAGHDDVSSVDTKEFSEFTDAVNPAAADAFLAWTSSKDAADIVAQHGLASPSNKVDESIYGPVIKYSSDALANAKLQFVMGDLLPGDLVDEYRVQLQKFLQDPSDATIDAVTQDLEAKAASSY